MTGACLFVYVVGPGFDSTSSAFVRSRTSHATGSDRWLAQKTESGPHIWGQGCVDTICTDVCVFQPRAGCVFLEYHLYVLPGTTRRSVAAQREIENK